MMTDEQKALAEKLNAMQQQQIEACRAEIAEVLKKYNCTLTGIPQYTQVNGAWLTTIAIGVALAKEDA